jgi:hypothetical protein
MYWKAPTARAKSEDGMMAKNQFLSGYQKGIVKRYYKHKDTLASQKLGEIVSELYLCESEKKAARLWKSAETALINAGANKVAIQKLMVDRDIERLAQMVGELF